MLVVFQNDVGLWNVKMQVRSQEFCWGWADPDGDQTHRGLGGMD